MASDRDALAAVIEDVGEWCGTDGCSGTPRDADAVAAAVVKGGWRPPARIATDWDLEELPDRTIVVNCYGTAAQKSDDMWEYPNEVGQFTSESIGLPATALWQPEVSHG